MMKKTTVCLLLAAIALAAAVPHSESAVVPEETFAQGAESQGIVEDNDCNVFGALDAETGVPMDLYTLADDILKEGKNILKEKLPGLLKCDKKRWYARKACEKVETGLKEAVHKLGAKSIVDQLVAALKPQAEQFFEDHNGEEIHDLAMTFGKAKAMTRKKAKTFVGEQLSDILGQLMSLLQVPLMKLIPKFFFKLIPGWQLVPKDMKNTIIDKVYDATTKESDEYAQLTKKFQELMHKAAAHIVKITTVDALVTTFVKETPSVCAFDLAMKFATSASC